MKIKRLAASLLAALLLAAAPVSALAREGDVLEAVYQSHVQSALSRLQAVRAPEFNEENAVYDAAPQLDAADPDALADEMEFIEDEEFNDELQQLEAQLYDAVQDADGTMYSQLNERQRNCYNALAEVPISRILNAARDNNGYRQIQLTISGIFGTAITGRVNGNILTPDAAGEKVSKSIYTDLRLAIVALRYDRPDMVWLGDMSYGYGQQRMTSFSARVTTAKYSFALEFNGNEAEMRKRILACADIIAKEARSMPDRYRKVKLVHDVLVLGNTYNHAAANKEISGIPYYMSHCAYSALIINDSYQPVCDGYSEAMKIVLDRMGIPCVDASSDTHMWNNVKMDDDRWYNVDVTWDDDDKDEINYGYFLIGSQTRVDGQTFNRQTSHIEENPFTPSSSTNSFTLRFPNKNTAAYEYLGHDYPPPRFPDVPRSEWYYDYVEKAAEAGLMQGDPKGHFKPGNNITRAEFARVVANLMGADLSLYGDRAFNDVPTNAWYAPAVDWIKQSGLMKGSDGNFRPTSYITRQEMCVVLYNMAQQQGLVTGSDAGWFQDHSSIASWARDAVYACKELGLVQGDAAGRFAPSSNTSRSAAATVFVKYLDLM